MESSIEKNIKGKIFKILKQIGAGSCSYVEQAKNMSNNLDYYFKAFANTQINNYIKKLIETEENKNKFYFNNSLYYFLHECKIKALMEIIKTKNEYNAQNNKYARMSIKANKNFYDKNEPTKEEEQTTNLIGIKMDMLGATKKIGNSFVI